MTQHEAERLAVETAQDLERQLKRSLKAIAPLPLCPRCATFAELIKRGVTFYGSPGQNCMACRKLRGDGRAMWK